MNLMTLTPRSGDNLDVIFHDLSTNNGNHILKQIVVTIFLLTAYCFSHGFLSFYPLIIAKDTIRLRKNSGKLSMVRRLQCTINKLMWYNSLWLWRWLPRRLLKHQSLSTTVLFRTTFTRKIILNLLIERQYYQCTLIQQANKQSHQIFN